MSTLMTIPPLHQYQFRGGRLVLATRRRAIVSAIYVFLILWVLLTLSGSAWAPVTSAFAYAADEPRERTVLASYHPKVEVPAAASPVSERALEAPPGPDPQQGIATYIQATNKGISKADATKFASHIVSSATEFGLDLSVFAALLKVESRFDPEARSGAGAMGMAQVIPKWHADRLESARKLFSSYSIYEPRLNIYVGAWALRDFITSSHSLQEALLLYNGSPTDERKAYAKLVMAEAQTVKQTYLSPVIPRKY